MALYKKIKTKFVDAAPAANSYATGRPAAFKPQQPVYYIKTEKGWIKKPKNQKDITEAFSDKKDALNIFLTKKKT